MKVGDLVKFSKEHSSSPGHEYVKDWLGVCVEIGSTGFHSPINEVKIMWGSPVSQISHYDEMWWGELEYNPFEVINESR